jgi:hypothetical protein
VQPNKPTDMQTDALAPDLLQEQVLNLVEIIELKWLLAGEGIRLHVERLQNDRDYAERALQQAMACNHPVVVATAVRLKRRLGLA